MWFILAATLTSNLGCPALHLDHGCAKKKLSTENRISCDALKLFEISRPDHRVTFFEPLFVLDGLLLDKFRRNGAPLMVVEVE